MTRPVIQATPERLTYLRELQERKKRLDASRLAQADAFRAIGYEPICKPRVVAKLAVERGEDAAVPEPCGRCPQEQFHRATEDAVLYGGAAGGGKSAALVAESIRVAVKFPGIRVLVLRRSYDELAESIYPEYRRFNWAEVLGGKWNKTDKEITFPNGSLIRLRYMETSDDASRRQGGAYQLLLVDELTLMPPGVVATIANERLRSAHGVPVLGLRASSNPGGASHGEVKSRYVDATGQGAKIITDDNGLSVRFIPARATDNPYLDDGYYRRLDAIPDPARRAAMRDGDWGQFSGQMFPELRWERHTCDPVALPAAWKRYVGVDWGYAAPWAVCWGAVDPDGRIWFYREIYEAGVGEADQALRILAAEGDHEYIAARWADDSMWNRLGDARPLADVYQANGVALTPAGKGSVTRIHGWQRWHSYMEEAPACPMHRAMQWQTCPKVHIFRTLPKMWWELSNLPHSQRGNPEDADTAAPDHLCLTAGTKVATETGLVPIERVTAGTHVWTRKGLRRVTAAGLTARNASTGTVLMSNGTVLRGTPNHPVWLQGRGWTRLDSVRYSDILLARPGVNAPSSTESMTNLVTARTAETSSRSVNTPSRTGAALVYALSDFAADTKPHDVYNLTVAGAPEFYANGVLVHNCDASRYLLINLGGETRFHFPEPDPLAGKVPALDPVAPGPDSYVPRPLPASIGGYPRLEGDDPWYGLMDR